MKTFKTLLLLASVAAVFVTPLHAQTIRNSKSSLNPIIFPVSPPPPPPPPQFRLGLDLKLDCGATGDGIADDTSALRNCVNLVNTSYAAGIPTYIFVPNGIFLIKGTGGALPRFNSRVPGAIIGAGQHKSYFQLDTTFAGDLFSWTESWIAGVYQSGMLPKNDIAGAIVSGFTVMGNLSAPSQQNVMMFYDRNDLVLIHDIDVFYVPGQCFSAGRRLNIIQAYMRESVINDLRCFNTGTTSDPAFEITTQDNGTTNDGSNEIEVTNLSIFASAGKGVVVSNSGTFGVTRAIRFHGTLRSENNGGNAVDIGLATDTGQVNLVDIDYIGNAGVNAGTYGLSIVGGAVQSYGIQVKGGNIGPGAGKGINLNNIRSSTIKIPAISTTDTNVTLGATLGGNTILDGASNEAFWTYAYSTSSVQSPYYQRGIPVSSGLIANAAFKGAGSTASSFRLTSDGTAANRYNCFNAGFSEGYGFSVILTAVDITSGAKAYVWTLPVAYFSSVFGVSAATLIQGTPAIVTQGTVTGAGVVASADTTNGCVSLVFTPPTGNTDTWKATANITFAQAK